jgi:DtxR family Mn-dependent transcriptional regulator
VESHDEACRLEHAVTDLLAASIEKTLDSPKTCPHGNPIPDEKGYLPPSKSEALANLQAGEHAVVSGIPELL